MIFSAEILQGYGLTETLGAAMVDDVHYKDISVGTIFSCVEAKIVNVPDLNYTVPIS